jgi:hypothetical protein
MTVHQHLLSRHLDTALHHVWVAEELGCATFPLWNLSGKLLGYQRYRPGASKALNNDPREGRYFTRVVEGNTAVWGLESWSLSNTLFLVEGLFDAARLTSRGYSAVAVFSNEPSHNAREWLYAACSNRRLVAVCDNDAPGLKLARFGHVAHVMEDGKDLGDANDSYVTNFLKEYA